MLGILVPSYKIIKNKFMQMDEVCELAHEKTKAECKRLNITMDKDDGDDCTIYTDKAQDIFNDFYDDVDNEFNN